MVKGNVTRQDSHHLIGKNLGDYRTVELSGALYLRRDLGTRTGKAC